ncbi:EAL domain-containing protein [Hyphomicrobium sp.]|uniref:EAL domain-containing protein n=1 Tax=Hyphomicrobium sp. TaxID=82 RepID=UPI000FAE4D1A|nr:EAL domain-containing protein [Hyphomicrobium sp.]RUP00502.1 MAG: cyclic diguanylate phosphodiesterase [Hyphomicrobium sp.]
MPILAKLFIDGRHSRKVLGAAWAVAFLLLLVAGYKLALWDIAGDLDRQNRAALAHVTQLHEFAISALQSLHKDATSPPCSEDFLRQMQIVAYRPDGLNVFFYAPQGIPKCGTNQASYSAAPPLGPPEVRGEGEEPHLWVNRDLQFLGMGGVSGTIAMLGEFGVVIPPYSLVAAGEDAPNSQLVVRGSDGKIWPLTGGSGLYGRLTATADRLGISSNVTLVSCGSRKIYCIASESSFSSWANTRIPSILLFTVVATLFAWLGAYAFVQWLTRYWSFEARFARNLDERSLVLAYQPIVELRSGRISGCEVLARWRDLDGSVVSPVRFLDLVRHLRRTLEFTELVAARAQEELMKEVPTAPLTVNFNVFASDFNTATMLATFGNLHRSASNLNVAIELVEDEDIDYDQAQLTIGELRQRGIKTYIDDFGTGYSSIERVATLAADGVKLDRSFAMSAPDSVLGRMFEQVLHLVHASGTTVIVEGIDSEPRLELLRATGLVQYVQGYLISRPVGISEFAAFLKKWNGSVASPATSVTA